MWISYNMWPVCQSALFQKFWPEVHLLLLTWLWSPSHTRISIEGNLNSIVLRPLIRLQYLQYCSWKHIPGYFWRHLRTFPALFMVTESSCFSREVRWCPSMRKPWCFPHLYQMFCTVFQLKKNSCANFSLPIQMWCVSTIFSHLS